MSEPDAFHKYVAFEAAMMCHKEVGTVQVAMLFHVMWSTMCWQHGVLPLQACRPQNRLPTHQMLQHLLVAHSLRLASMERLQ